jgi:cell division protein FtsQ
MIKINRKVVSVTIWAFMGAALVVLLGFSDKEQQMQKCKGLKVVVADNSGNYFIEPRDIVELLNTSAGKVKNREMMDINLSLLEKTVYTNPFIAKAEVYTTIDGFVNINVWQRNPVLRIVNFDNEHYYIDDDGGFMPVTDKFTSMVPIATGYIFDKFAQRNLDFAVPFLGDSTSKPMLVQLNEISQFLLHNEFWDAQIEQIYVNENHEIELIPRVGNHSILIGSSENLELKMNNLYIFYTQGINKKGWENYSSINLKYNNQVICTKTKNQKSNS